jgi:hypothetical protein
VAEAPAFSVDWKVGRLVEARLIAPHTPQEIVDFTESLRRIFAVAGKSCVICADWRMANLLAPEVADALVDLLRQGNSHFERSAVLLAGRNPVFELQVERVIREAANPSRRVFRKVPEMRAWLSEILSPAETWRVREFLDEHA